MIEKIGIIGAGQKGIGIAQICILAGYSVFLNDISTSTLPESLSLLNRFLEKLVARNKLLFQEKEDALTRLSYSTDLQGVGTCDLIIETLPEKEELKKSLITSLIPHLSPHCLLATSTSSFSVTSLATVSDRPDKFIGMNFFSPLLIIHLIEIIRGLSTSPTTLHSIIDVTKRLGKEMIISEDYPGFTVNRILMPMINEAMYALYEGIGTTESIDKGMRLGTNHSMGPLEFADVIGLDVCMFNLTTLYKGLSGRQYKPCPLLVKYVEAGWLGRKTNRGFYDYTGEHPIPTYRRNLDVP